MAALDKYNSSPKNGIEFNIKDPKKTPNIIILYFCSTETVSLEVEILQLQV